VHRTQIYLTEGQRKALRSIARRLGRTQSDIIRTAVDRYIQADSPSDRIELLRQARAMWKSRDDLPGLRSLREEFDRLQP
jgi:hypothetical protein